jgi:hypothetical protein
MHFLPANRLRLYRNFKALEATDFYGIIRFYERFEEGVRALELEAFFECTLAYTNALFETGQYGKHLVMCDFMLELIIRHNIDRWGGEDIFTKILYDKAVSLVYQREYARAAHVTREILKIHPLDQSSARLLKKSLLRQKPTWLLHARAWFMLFIFLSAATVAIQIFVIQTFFSDYDLIAQYVYYGFLGLGLSILLFAEWRHTWLSNHRVNSFKKQILARNLARERQVLQ